MKARYIQTLSIMLAAMIQTAPLLRSLMPATQGLAPSTWGMILKIGVGATALLGFDAVSQASSISITPANATVGVAYVGTVAYSGNHAGAVSAMQVSSTCLGTVFLGNGLSITYAGGNKATVTGTPTTAGTLGITAKVFDSAGCGSGHTDTRSTTLVIGTSGGGNSAPVISAAPQNVCAQVGSDVQLSGGAGGNPIPQYQWWQGSTPLAGQTNSVLTLTNVQLTSAQLYTLTASNVLNAGNTFLQLPKANCFLSVCITGGTNFSAFNYTNFYPAGAPLTMFSYVTNVSTASNFYSWAYNSGSTISTSNTYSKTAFTPGNSGNFQVQFVSTNATSGYIITNGQALYDSYWAFGYLPAFTNQLPATTNVNAGSSVTFAVPLKGTLNVYTVSGTTTATNNAPCVFWYKDATTLVGSQILTNNPTSLTLYTNSVVTATLTLNSIAAGDAGDYTVVATNYWGSTTSSPVALTVVGGGGSGPGITVQPPASLGLLVGQSSSISVTATGTPSLFYQWRRNGADLGNGSVYGGVLTNTLTLTSVGTNNAGNYSVVITNSINSVTSGVTALTVSLPPSASFSPIGTGSAVLGFTTIPGLTYVVERTANLTGSPWVPILTNVVPGSGVVLYTNTTGNPSEYFRLHFP